MLTSWPSNLTQSREWVRRVSSAGHQLQSAYWLSLRTETSTAICMALMRGRPLVPTY